MFTAPSLSRGTSSEAEVEDQIVSNPRPLLCELHAHTTWSDGTLPLAALVDLYGSHGFDVLCVTDHVLPPQAGAPPRHVHAGNFEGYRAEIEGEAERARALYDLVLIAGLELTDHADDPDRSAHALALGVHAFVPLDSGLLPAIAGAGEQGVAIIAAHPAGPDALDLTAGRATRRFWSDFDALRPFVDRYELVNRHDVFGWVARERLPAVATGDFHRLEHLTTWKTFVPCAKREEEILLHLCSEAPVYLARPELVAGRAAA